MARDDLKKRIVEILDHDGVSKGVSDRALDDIIEEVLRATAATAADVAKKAMEWLRSRKADES